MLHTNIQDLGDLRQIAANLTGPTGFPLRHRTAGHPNKFGQCGLRQPPALPCRPDSRPNRLRVHPSPA